MRLFFQKKIYCKLKMEINFFEAIQNFIRKEYRQRKHFVGDPPTQFKTYRFWTTFFSG